ncbi:DUF1345 domain-containing protein [Rhizobium sp. Leaf341]|uniref:DUF1345 domain-containing protein n=1 Tax=Rhizobium sp. Leaf341 TaxID=1736344 RepID=UPI00071538F2|nr:hypothetical protein ASG03_10905 [Rhizobium sp. Leaf341]
MAGARSGLIPRRHLPFSLGAMAAALSLPLGLLHGERFGIELAAVLFFLVYLVMIAIRVPKLSGAFLKENAAGTDEPEFVILGVTLAAVVICLASLFQALNEKDGAPLPEQILAFASVALGWLTVHTMAAIHYAHRYWSPDLAEDGTGQDGDRRGLDFPGTDMPGIFDFLYFSFVIGMTAQTSDVAINTTAMRKINLLHAVVSYFFNTVLIAVAVNAAVALL